MGQITRSLAAVAASVCAVSLLIAPATAAPAAPAALRSPASVESAVPGSTDQWAYSAGDAGHNHYNAAATAITAANAGRLRPVWTRPSSAEQVASPIVDGVVFVPRMTGNMADPGEVTAIAAATGAVRWRTELPMLPSPNLMAYANGILYLTGQVTNGQNVCATAVDARSGAVLWTARATSPLAPEYADFNAGDLAVDAGRLYLMGNDGSMDAFDARTGSHLWSHPHVRDTDRDSELTPPLLAAGGKIGYTTLIKTASGAFTRTFGVYNGATDELLWQPPAGEQTLMGGDRNEALVAGRLYLADYHRLSSYSWDGCGRATCAATWQYRYPKQTGPYINFLPPTAATVAGGDGTQVIVLLDQVSNPQPSLQHLMTLSAVTGAVTWSVDTQDLADVAGASGLVYVLNQQNLLAYRLGCAGCAPIQLAYLPGTSGSPAPTVSVADGTVVVQRWLSGGTTALRLVPVSTSASLSGLRVRGRTHLIGQLAQHDPVSGTVPASVRSVSLQAYLRGSWRTVAHTASSPRGQVLFTVSEPAGTRFRLVVGASSTGLPGVTSLAKTV